MITVEDALRIALEAHDGQKDLDGNPAIWHPIAVALRGRNREEQVAGLLHDVVEDSDITFDDLLQRGVDEKIVDVLRLLTHVKDTAYEDYVKRIANSGNDVVLIFDHYLIISLPKVLHFRLFCLSLQPSLIFH